MEGDSFSGIAKYLTEQGIPTPAGKKYWQARVVKSILENEKYYGAALLQKRFVEDFLTKKVRKNIGQLPQYFVENDHEPVLLARSLCATKKLLLLDEPAVGLDPMVTNELYHLIQQINQNGITIIMASHDIKSAVKYASHILHLHNKQLFFGTTVDYIKSDAGKYFLGGKKNA